MSLVRLLTAGKSLVGVTDELSPYRVTNERLLPKFISAKNPFRATTRPGSVLETRMAMAGPSLTPDLFEHEGERSSSGAAVLAGRGENVNSHTLEPVELAAPKNEHTPLLERSAREAEAPARVSPPAVSAAPVRPSTTDSTQTPVVERNVVSPAAKEPKEGWFRRNWTRLGAWLVRPFSRPSRGAIPRFGKAPVQAELSLERVRVVRNDLSESDLEIVRKRAQAAARGESDAVATPAAGIAQPPAEGRKARFRFFGAGKH